MIYPSLIGGFALLVLVALVVFLVPVFEKIFADFGGGYRRSRSSPSGSRI